MEYIDKDIKELISVHREMIMPIPEEDLWELLYQSMTGLYCIHKNNIIHRNIKPKNSSLTDNKIIKIGNFGYSIGRKSQNIAETKLEKEKIKKGTPVYMSPEMLKNEEYGSKVDIYSLGCSFFEMCFYTPPRIPFINSNLEKSNDLIDVEIKYNKGLYSIALFQIIQNMIQKDPEKRYNSQKIFDMIKNEYNKKFIVLMESLDVFFL